jgi:hypothetical protein
MLLEACHLKIPKKLYVADLGLNCNDVEIDITWRSLVEEHQYFLIPIASDANFRNVMELFVQNKTNMIELYVSSQSKLRSSYNVKYRDTNVYLFHHLDNYHIQLKLIHLGHWKIRL